jgi:hypothetical protein
LNGPKNFNNIISSIFSLLFITLFFFSHFSPSKN